MHYRCRTELLDAMGMPQKEWVDGEVLKELDNETLEELGVTSKLHRLNLTKECYYCMGFIVHSLHSLEKFFVNYMHV